MANKINNLFKHKGFVRYFNNTAWLFGEKIIRMFVGLFVGIWVARYLGPEKFGVFSYAQSFVGLFATIATLGLDGIVVREIVKDESKTNELIGTTFVLKGMGALAVLILLAIAILFTSHDSHTNKIVFIIASATVFQSFNVIDIYFQAKVLSKYVVYANTISLFISSIVKITLILSSAPLIAFAWAILFDNLILALGYIYFLKTSSLLQIKNLRFNALTAKILLNDSWPLIISSVVISIYMKIDQVMIKEMIGNEAVGQYSAAVRISEAWYFIPIVITTSLFPAIVNAKSTNDEIYYARLQKLYNLMVLMALSIALPMTFLSDWTIEILFGKAYNEAASVLMIHIWAGIFVFLGVASGKWFTAENEQFLAFRRTLYGLITNITLNYILIPIYGIQGAAIATIVSQLFASFLSDLMSKKTKRMFLMKTRAIFFLDFLYKPTSK
ncbi:flippase [Achromobacter sp. F4_2707]|uniref:flippase n=1 Tax=Achromobacter sp. F4_2707 TaxID=3114286 RepID=UPI0039C69218